MNANPDGIFYIGILYLVIFALASCLPMPSWF